jgi:cullin 3
MEQSQGFEGFTNTNPKAPEFISLFLDENLKKGVKDVSYVVTHERVPL